MGVVYQGVSPNDFRLMWGSPAAGGLPDNPDDEEQAIAGDGQEDDPIPAGALRGKDSRAAGPSVEDAVAAAQQHNLAAGRFEIDTGLLRYALQNGLDPAIADHRNGWTPPPTGGSPGDSPQSTDPAGAMNRPDSSGPLPPFPFRSDASGSVGVAPNGPPTPPTFRNGPYTYLPPPGLPALASLPVRDSAAEAKRGDQSSLWAALFGGLLGGGQGALSAYAGARQGFDSGADKAYQASVGRVSDENNRALLGYRAADAQTQQANQATRLQAESDAAYNRAQLSQYRTDTNAYNDAQRLGQQAADSAARLGLDTKMAGDRQDQATAQERGRVLDLLSNLDDESQQSMMEMMDRSGDLKRLGLPVTRGGHGRYNLTLRQAPKPETPEDPDQAKRDQYQDELKEQYGILSDPRLTEDGQRATLKRIGQLQQALGYGTGQDGLPPAIFADMTPYQREIVNLRGQQQGETARANRAREAQKAEALTLAQGNYQARIRGMSDQERRGWLGAKKIEWQNAKNRLLDDYQEGRITLPDFQQRRQRILDDEDAATGAFGQYGAPNGYRAPGFGMPPSGKDTPDPPPSDRFQGDTPVAPVIVNPPAGSLGKGATVTSPDGRPFTRPAPAPPTPVPPRVNVGGRVITIRPGGTR